MLIVKMKLPGKHVDNSREFAMDLKPQYTYWNVLPLTVNTIKNRIDSIFDENTYLMKVSNDNLSTIRLPFAILFLILNTLQYNKNSGV